MAVTERHMGTGNFTVSFNQEFTPTEIVESIQEWGHIVITPQEIDTTTLTDAEIKNLSIYTGIVLNRALEEGMVEISGRGLQLYLGDGAGKGMVIAESNNIGKVRNYTGTTLAETLFNSTAQTNKPLGIMRDESGNLQAITQGTITNPAGTYTGTHFVETALSALKFVSEVLDTEYRVNMNGTIDAGPAANLFQGVGTATPNTIVVKTAYGQDPNLEGVVPIGLRTEFDAADFVTRVDFTGEVGFFDIATDVAGEANLSSIPYKDLHGNALKRVALVQEPDVPEALLNTRAQTFLNELSRVKKVLNLDLEQYEVSGDLKVGDFIFAFDPDIDFVDTQTDATAESRSLYEIAFRGQTINPVKVRVKGITWPISNGMGCYFRDKDGNYTDLSQYVEYETGQAQVELGDVLRGIGDDLRYSQFSLARQTAGVFSIPDLPSTPTLQSGTYLDGTGISKGFIRVVVSRPTNIDGSQITDGASYGVRYKKLGDAQYSFQSFPYTGVATESLLIQDLTVGTTYQVGVNVVDKSGFKKMSAFDGSGEDLYTDSSSVNANFATNARIEIQKDGQAPSKPKTATIASGPLRVQVTHSLGKDGTDGNGNPFGNFTLEGDIDYLAVHAVTQSGNSQNFTVAEANKIGEIRVTAGNLLQQIPVIGTINLADSSAHYFRLVAVDKSGNASNPSDGQSATATLIEESHIADATITTAKIGTAQITNALIADATIDNAKIANLNAGKINAGTISADRIGANSISTSKLNFTPISSSNVVASINASTEGLEINAARVDFSNVVTIGSALDIGGSDSTSFHVDSDGNMFLGAGSIGSAPFKVTKEGALTATSVTASDVFVTGIPITPSQVDSAVNMDAASTLTDNLTLTGSGKIRTASSGSRIEMFESAGVGIINFFADDNELTMSMQAGNDEFQLVGGADDNVKLSTVSGKQFEVNAGHIKLNAYGTVSGGEIRLGTPGNVDVKIGIAGNSNYNFGSSGQVLQSTGNGITWANTSGHSHGNLSFPNAGTVLSDSNHNHSGLAASNHGHNGFANSGHGHNNFASNNHDHDSSYSGTNHNHNAFASSFHTHNNFANSTHNHSNMANQTYVNSQILAHRFDVAHSDERLKENITEVSLGLDFINRLQPRDFSWKSSYLDNEYSDEVSEDSKYKTFLSNTQQGFIAQEVQSAVLAETGSNSSFGGVKIGDVTDSDKTYSSDSDDFGRVDYNQFVAPLVKAVQQLSSKIDLLEARIDELENP